MPRWLKTMLLIAGLVVGAAFLAEPVLLVFRRLRASAHAAAVPEQAREPVLVPRPRYGREPDRGVLPRRRPASSWPISTRSW